MRRRRAVLIVLMGLAAAAPAYGLRVRGINLTGERVILVCCLLAAIPLAGGLRQGLRRLGLPQAAYALFLGLCLVFALASHVGRVSGMRTTLLLAVVALPFVILPAMGLDRRELRLAVWVYVGLAAAEATIGLVLLGAAAATGSAIPGTVLDDLTQAPEVAFSQWEPNTFSSFVAAGAVLLLALLMSRANRPRRARVLGAVLAVMLLAVALDLSRGAWLGTLVGGAVTLALVGRRRLLGALVAVSLTATIVVVAVAGPRVPALAPLATRLGSLSQLLRGNADGNSTIRFNAARIALDEWSGHPLKGTGPGTGLGTRDSSTDPHFYVSNLEIRALRDTGLVGFGALLTALAAVGWALWRRRRQAPALTAGLLGALAVLLVAFQATDATWLSYPWYLMGLAWAVAGSAAPPGQPRAEGPPAAR